MSLHLYRQASDFVLSTIKSPKKGVFGEISHRSRIAALTARKEVGNQFYLGNLITLFFCESSQAQKAVSIMGSCDDQGVLIHRNASFLSSHHTRLKPYAYIVLKPIAKSAALQIVSNDPVKPSTVMDESNKISPINDAGAAKQQFSHHNLSKSLQPNLNCTPENSNAGTLASNKKLLINSAKFRYKGSLAWHNANILESNTTTKVPIFLATARLMVGSFGLGCERNDSQPHLKQRQTANETCHAIAYHWSSPPLTLLAKGIA